MPEVVGVGRNLEMLILKLQKGCAGSQNGVFLTVPEPLSRPSKSLAQCPFRFKIMPEQTISKWLCLSITSTPLNFSLPLLMSLPCVNGCIFPLVLLSSLRYHTTQEEFTLPIFVSFSLDYFCSPRMPTLSPNCLNSPLPIFISVSQLSTIKFK